MARFIDKTLHVQVRAYPNSMTPQIRARVVDEVSCLIQEQPLWGHKSQADRVRAAAEELLRRLYHEVYGDVQDKLDELERCAAGYASYRGAHQIHEGFRELRRLIEPSGEEINRLTPIILAEGQKNIKDEPVWIKKGVQT